MGREIMKGDSIFSHKLIKESPLLKITGDGLFADRMVSDNRLNPARTNRKLGIATFSKRLTGDKGLCLGRINWIAGAPSSAFFNPSIRLLNGNPPVRTIAPLIKTRHLYKVWNAVNTKANQIRVNQTITNKFLRMSRTGGSNPSRTGYCYATTCAGEYNSKYNSVINLFLKGSRL